MDVEERADFRCLGCGLAAEIEAPTGTLTLGIKQRPLDARAPTCLCGGKRWARVDSMTEFYSYSRRDDVCRVGDHIDSRARPRRLSPQSPPGSAHIPLVSLQVNVCPDHVTALRTHGIHGWFLLDDD